MDKEAFVKEYCESSNTTTEELLKTQVVLECNCGYSSCMGWAIVSNNPMAIKAHQELYM